MTSRSLLLTWYVPLLGGLVPILVVGFLASGVADRLAFAGWALALAILWAVLLRQGIEAGWGKARRVGGLALLLAAGLLAWAALLARYGEDLDLGLRAVFPAIHHEALSRPVPAVAAAAALAAAGAAGLVRGRRSGEPAAGPAPGPAGGEGRA
jgi:hypothetical protein